ncbi:Protein inscuteable [Orchesella cincta]|uniref:Protein inscuteable n=1 Tax=Orchesella cincta TaxID=48709 RepID=A0A1D2NB60_ORCCI|nr:Protein inscuteable [Orchesella cincta]
MILTMEFCANCVHLEFGIFTQVPTLVLSLVGHIEDFLRVFHNSIGFGNLTKLENRLESACYALHMAAKSMNEAALMISSSCSDSGHNSNVSSRTGSSSSHPRSASSSSTSTAASSPDCMPLSSSSGGDPFLPSSSGLSSSADEHGPESLGRDYHVVVSEVVEGIVTVGNLFSQVVDLRLTRDLACILDTIEGGGIPARVALKSLVTVLADGGNHICRLAADIRTVRGLLGVLLDTREDQDKILALRCLATVLCVGEAVKDFDKFGWAGWNSTLKKGSGQGDKLSDRTFSNIWTFCTSSLSQLVENALKCLQNIATHRIYFRIGIPKPMRADHKHSGSKQCEAGGFEIIADLLYEPTYSTWMKIEAVAVLTQATDPWIDLETTLMTLGVHLEKFIVSLTNLIREFKTEEEPFLLIVAAISNLTFLEVSSTLYLKNCRCVSYLIDAVKGNPSFSVFVLDHVATIMANMAGVESCRHDIIQCGGMDALLHFLQQRPSAKLESVSAITACERLQQKSTIAISRLCNENGVARYVYDMGGVHRLVQLCRKEKERNYSDGVLIAALIKCELGKRES